MYVLYLAVGMLCLAMKSFANAFEPSNCAAFCDGPKTGIPAFLNAYRGDSC